MTWQQQSTEGKHVSECLLVSRRLLLLSRLFWKNVSHPLYTFNRLCTTHTLYYTNLAIQSIHSLRTTKNKKTTEIQCFISDFSSHILTMLQWYCFRHCQQIFRISVQSNKMLCMCVLLCVYLCWGAQNFLCSLGVFILRSKGQGEQNNENTCTHLNT